MSLVMRILPVLEKVAQLPLGEKISKFALVRKLYHSLHHYVMPKSAVVHGHVMYVNPRDESCMTESLVLRGVWEEQMTKLFQSIAKEGMVVVDLGANIGYYTLIAAKLVGEKGKVFAFEPEPDNYALLVRNIEENEYKNVCIPVPKAVSNRTGTMKLFLDPYSKGNHTIGPQVYDSQNTWGHILVDVTTLDKFFEKYNDSKIDVIKLDVEGAEEEAFDGMTNIVKKDDDLKIFAELYPVGLRSFGSSPESFLNKLIAHGFKLHIIDEQNGSVYLADVNSAIRICEENQQGWVNIFCTRSNL